MSDYQICARCICDTSIKGITFDEDGICNYCRTHDALERQYALGESGEKNLDKLIAKIKKAGRNKKYDCIVGLSGGTDSTYCLYKAVKLGLRPVAVHLDNGWNTEIANKNIENTVNKLGVDLKVVKLDWDEFKDIQIAFLKASVPDAEIPTDIAIIKTLYQVAASEGVRYVLNGHSFRVEGLSPLHWTYMEGKYIKSVHAKFGTMPMMTFPNLLLMDLIRYAIVKRIKVIPLLAYFEYSKEESKELLGKELAWTYYGGHHFESAYTRFVITNLLWKKFNIDKRITEYSAHVRSGQLARVKALEMRQEPIPDDADVAQYCLNKLNISIGEFNNILNTEPRSFLDYPTYYSIIKLAKVPIYLACRLHILPKIFYEKYFA